MSKLIDLIGQKFNRLTVVSRAKSTNGNTRWHCRCECGGETVAASCDIKSGRTKSCGCFNRDRITSHGNCGHVLYKTWYSMIQRCTNPSAKSFSDYGERGITVCDRWLNSFETFCDDMGDKPTPRHSVERKENDSGYSPENCKWATAKEQQNNTRYNVNITVDGVTKTLAQWAEVTGINHSALNKRYLRGWSHHDIIKRPVCN